MYQMRLFSKVMVLKSKRKVVSIPPPSITIFARHKKIGWKSRAAEITTTKDILRRQCNHSLDTGLVECIKEKTFDLKETIKDAYLWYSAKETTSLMEPTFWSTHFTSMKFGRGHTLTFPWNASADYDQVYLHLSHLMEYTIFIHDDKFFMVSENPLALSTLYVAFNPNQTFSHYERLVVTENQLLENCEPTPGYSFQSCIHQVAVSLGVIVVD